MSRAPVHFPSLARTDSLVGLLHELGHAAAAKRSGGLLNLAPVAPLDGGRAARALIAGIFRV